MAELWDSVVLHTRIWQASRLLGSTYDPERMQAIQTLIQAGPAAIPCLRVHLLRERTPRAQFAAAVALHRLDRPEGLETLQNALRSMVDTPPDNVRSLLQEAFLTIGSPAATSALLSAWSELREWEPGAPIPPDSCVRVQTICQVWAQLQDPTVLDALLAYSTRIPHLFPPTVAAFGQMAVRKLREAAQSSIPLQRLLIVRALARIPGEASFQTLTPLLRDMDPEVRAETCRALIQVGAPAANGEAITRALQAGYSTEAAVRLLAATGHPLLFHTLLQLIERAGSLSYSTNDTPAAVQVALDLLIQAPWSPDTLLRIVCALLEKPLPREVQLAGIAHLGALQAYCPGQEARAQAVLWDLLAAPASEVRNRAAQALLAWGEPNAKRFLDLLTECRPQGSFLEKLTTLLRGGPDASQAATQAFQQVQQWVTHLSREAVVRLSSPAPDREPPRTAPRHDPRTPALLRRLLAGALRHLHAVQTLEETEEALALSITAMRALRRLGAPDALPAQPELLHALLLQKPLMTTTLSYGAYVTAAREVGEPVREEAALALIEFLGAESFGLFLQALQSPHTEVQGTAILALGRLADARAVPYLQPIAADPDNPLAPHAVQALATIRQHNPEMMTLLRGSSLQDTQPETLLRPLPYARPDTAPELLLRPTSKRETLP